MSKPYVFDVRKIFAKNGARERFRKLVDPDYVSAEEVEAMIEQNNGELFKEYLRGTDQSIVYTVDWGALWHCNSGKFEILHFEGFYFSKVDYSDEIDGPFGSAIEAAEGSADVFLMEYSDDAGTAGSIHYSSEVPKEARKLIPKRLASKLFEILTGHGGTKGDFYWAEVVPGKLFKDPFHDPAGKALQELHEAQKGGVLDAISAAELKLKAITKKERVDDYVLGEEAKHFTSAFDSFLMKVPLCSKGKLARFSAEWVRICCPRRIGKKTLATVIRIDNPMGLIDDLVPVPDGQ